METLSNIPSIAHVIQQAVAPVFLLTGIGSILSVLTNRLGRVVDRFRILCDLQINTTTDKNRQAEMRLLALRARWIHGAISLCTISALCICLSIAALFLAVELNVDLSEAIALLFILAMLSLIAGLLCFLREISLATGLIELNESLSKH